MNGADYGGNAMNHESYEYPVLVSEVGSRIRYRQHVRRCAGAESTPFSSSSVERAVYRSMGCTLLV